MAVFRRFVQHHFNPLHVYCRLRDVGVRQGLTTRVCLLYEKWVYRFLSF